MSTTETDWSQYGKCDGTCHAAAGQACVNIRTGMPIRKPHTGRTKSKTAEPPEPAEPQSHHLTVTRGSVPGYGDVWTPTCSCGDFAGDSWGSPDAAGQQHARHLRAVATVGQPVSA